jgi:hypothetical protein
MARNKVYLEIGGARFVLLAPEPLHIIEPDIVYRNFIHKTGKEAFIEIAIDIETGAMPDMKDMSLVIDNGESWAIYSAGDDYFFVHKAETYEHPFWGVRLRGNLASGTLYCGQAMVEEARKTGEIVNPFRYPLDQLIMMYILAHNSGAIIHAAGIEKDGLAYVFPGKSGAGKSTISRQFRGSGDVSIFSDDRIILRRNRSVITAYGTPWPGEEEIAEDREASLAGIFFMTHAVHNSIKELTPSMAAEKLIPVISLPWYDKEMTEKTLAFCEELISIVPSYELRCRPGPEAAELVMETARRATRG